MAKYLDPKADLTFKKVFGEHKELLISFLNAMLPLPEGKEIVEIEYLPVELAPETPLIKKNSIVDVRCKDIDGRLFIVEMQMEWQASFKQRMLFNASKVYVRQLDKGKSYDALQPVYALSLINDIYEKGDDYYHHYKIVEEEHTERVFEGLEMILVELPKFTPTTYSEKKMQMLWLRYLTEIDEKTRQVDEEMLCVSELKTAIDILEESSYTEAQLAGYDMFWDAVRVERGRVSDSEKRIAEGIAKGIAEERKLQEQRRHEEKLANAKNLKALSVLTPQQIADSLGLTVEEVEFSS